MILGIDNDPRPYDWGSRTALAALRGRAPGGGPEAELWLGAHPACPSRLLDPARADGHDRLDAWIAADPAGALGATSEHDGAELPFLLKVLAADSPLSIQVHPDAQRARAGFAEETARGLDLSDPCRTYRDPHPKPELALAVGGDFEALIGVRPAAGTASLLRELSALAGEDHDARRTLDDLRGQLEHEGDAALPAVLDRALDPDAGRGLLAALQASAGGVEARADDATEDGRGPSLESLEARTLAQLCRSHPGDPGIGVALLLNRVSIPAGSAVRVGPGTIHAYLRGTAVELMAPSDNVVRAGLTTKHVDAAELRRIADLRPAQIRPAAPDAGGALRVGADGPGIVLAGDGQTVRTGGAAVALALDGPIALHGRLSHHRLERGEAAVITPQESPLDVRGPGRLVLAAADPAVSDPGIVSPRVPAQADRGRRGPDAGPPVEHGRGGPRVGPRDEHRSEPEPIRSRAVRS